MKLGQAVTDYVAFCDHWKDPVSLASKLSRLFPAGKACESVTRDDINGWTANLMDQGLNPNYVRHLMGLGGAMFNWLIGEGHIQHNPFKLPNLKRPPQVRFERVPFTYEEYRAALAEADRPRRRVGLPTADYVPGGIRVGFFTGLRISDVARLSWLKSKGGNWVDLDQGLIVAHPSKLKRFRQELQIPIAPELGEWLSGLVDRDGWVFPIMRAISLYDRQGISRAFTTVFRRAGLPHTFHSFRHGFVTRLINQGVDPIVIGQMTGQSARTIERYSHVSMEAKRAAVAKLI